MRTRSRFGSVSFLLMSLCFGAPAAVAGDLNHGVVWYAKAPDDSIRHRAARRYDVGVTGKGDGGDAERVAMKAMNPEFRWFVYNSGTDNYVTSPTGTPEHDLLVSLAASHGWDVEEAYLHYWDDTRVVMEGETLLVRGWGGGSAANGAEARVPVYYKNLSRRLVNFSTARAAQLHREVIVKLAFDAPFAGSNVYPDGVFLDNSTAQVFSYGTILSGGHVRETPNHPVLGSPAHLTWHWNVNYGPFLTTLKDTLEAASSWAADGKRKYLMQNVANIWNDGYVTLDTADILFMEFQYNCVRSFGTGMVAEAYRRDKLAAAAGIQCFYSATMTRSVPGHVGQYTYAETLLHNLSWYLVTRTAGTLFYEMGANAPTVAGWDTLTWRGCLDVANDELGNVVGEPFALASGTDPLGNPYTVTARNYERGLAIVRNVGEWDEGIETATAVNVPLQGSYAPVSPEGSTGSFVSSVSLRSGQGMLFLDHAVAVTLESFTVSRLPDGKAMLEWRVGEASPDHLGFDVYRGDARGPQEKLTTELLQGWVSYQYVDATAPPEGARYWLAEKVLSGAVQWYGPVELAGLPQELTWLGAAEPNPFRDQVVLRFGLEQGGTSALRVYDVRGRIVRSLYAGAADGQRHELVWDGTDAAGVRLAPGVYFYRLETQTRVITRKVHLAY